MSDWGSPSEPASGALAGVSVGVAAIAESLYEVDAAIAAMEEKREALREQIKSHVPPQPGEYALDAGKYVVTVNRTERLKWDSDKLEERLISKTMPDYIKRRLSIDRRRWDALSADEQDRYAEALSIVPGRVIIDVKEKV